MQFLFTDHVLDVDRRELRRRAELIAVEPQVFDLILYLVRNRERVVSKDDLGEIDRGVELLRRAIELDPSNAQAHVALAAAMIRRGEFESGIRSMQYGMRSSPKDFRLTFWSMILADALVRAGRPEEAADVATTASRRDGRLYGARVVSAWALRRLNRTDEARTALAEARRIRPKLSLDEIQRFFGRRAAGELESVWN